MFKMRSLTKSIWTSIGSIGLMTSNYFKFSARAYSSAADIPSDYAIEFMTDVEGHIGYFTNLCSNSDIIELRGDSMSSSLSLSWKPEYEQNGYLVFCGDALDRGVGDLRIVRALVEFKHQPGNYDRVIFILGNRDINKLRLWREVTNNDEEIKQKLCNHPSEFTLYQRDFITPLSEPVMDEFRNYFDRNDSVSKLKWIVQHTMGAPKTFECRRNELVIIDGKSIGDEDVLQSFLNSVDPNGDDNYLWQYIFDGTFIHRIDNNIFMHSFFSDNLKNLDAMKQKSEEWKEYIMNEYVKNPKEFDYYSMHHDIYVDSAIYNENIKALIPLPSTEDEQKAKNTKRMLKEKVFVNGITRLFNGHIPIGESPTVVKVEGDEPLYVINGDTGYSGGTFGEENRGGAFANIRITHNNVRIKGVTANEKCTKSYPSYEYECTLPEDEHIGRIKDGGLIKYPLDEQDKYVAQQLDGYNCRCFEVNASPETKHEL